MSEVKKLEEKNKCDHTGFWKGNGFFSLPVKDGLMIGSVLYCENCGVVTVRTVNLFGLAVPPAGINLSPFDLIQRRRS